MKGETTNVFAKVLSVIAVALVLITMSALTAFSQEKTETTIMHKPADYFVGGHRIQVDAKVSDEAGVSLVRCYFRTEEEAKFVFVAMSEVGEGHYRGILPAPSEHTERIIYLLLAVNSNENIVKTQEFLLKKDREKEIPEWQQTSSKGNIRVNTELAQFTESPKGFSDSIIMDLTESSARFGVFVGLYPSDAGAMAWISGLSTKAVVGIGAGAAIGIFGINEIVRNNSDESGDESDPERPVVVPPYPNEYARSTIDRIAIYFSENMSKTHSVSVNSPEWAHSDSTDYWENQRTFYITRENAGRTKLTGGTEIRFKLTDFKDVAGNILESYSFSITVADDNEGDVIVQW